LPTRFLYLFTIQSQVLIKQIKKEGLTVNESKIVKEQRKSPRVKTSIPVRYKELRDEAETVDVGSLTCDVSAGGLRFTTDKLISTACRLLLEFDIPSLTKPIKAVSKVAWIQKANMGEGYEVGNEFVDITQKDQELIAAFLRRS
jgi:c-di-GMP-binding flagellar brake protein YcgR